MMHQSGWSVLCIYVLVLSFCSVDSFCIRRRVDARDFLAVRASVLSSGTDVVDHKFPRGSARGHYVVKFYKLSSPFDWSILDIEERHAQRLQLQPTNITLPVALLLSDDDAFGSLSQARKACRKGNILVKRNGHNSTGRVGDRIYPGDTVARQIRLASKENDYTANIHYSKPPFDLPVVYEDDTMALVNKPAGVVVYRQGSGSTGLLSVRAALPFVLTPPRTTSQHMLRRPASVHRLDKATSGLLVVAKTKPAMIKLSRQFHDRKIQKTYHAIVLGIPEEDWDNMLTSSEVRDRYGVNVPPHDTDGRWQVIDSEVGGKPAVTIWRALRYVNSLGAGGHLTLVEMHPKTGRYHQLRRHMAWVCRTPIVGDTTYDKGTPTAKKFRQNGLFLCASRITLHHLGGSSIHQNTSDHSLDGNQPLIKIEDCTETNQALLSASVPLPNKFSTLLDREESRYYKFSTEEKPPT